MERSHHQIVRLLSEGRTTREVCEVTGYSPGWVRTIARRYNERGAERLGRLGRSQGALERGARLLPGSPAQSLHAGFDGGGGLGDRACPWLDATLSIRRRQASGERRDGGGKDRGAFVAARLARWRGGAWRAIIRRSCGGPRLAGSASTPEGLSERAVTEVDRRASEAPPPAVCGVP
jgi:hypothetical protein